MSVIKKSRIIEITVQDIYSVRAAIEGGAQRVELCSALDTEGLTPSTGLVERAVEAAKKAKKENFVAVLIRPRTGDFVYSPDDIETIICDIRRITKLGVDAIVAGALNKDGTVDVESTLKMIRAADRTPVVFSRAFDVAKDQFEAMEKLIDLGITRILTSGAAPTTGEGKERIRELVRRSAGRIEIMAGGGVKIDDIPDLFAMGVDAVHLSCRHIVSGGRSLPRESSSYSQADIEKIKAAVAASQKVL